MLVWSSEIEVKLVWWILIRGSGGEGGDVWVGSGFSWVGN